MDLIDILKCTLFVIGIVILTPIVFSILFPIMSIFFFHLFNICDTYIIPYFNSNSI